MMTFVWKSSAPSSEASPYRDAERERFFCSFSVPTTKASKGRAWIFVMDYREDKNLKILVNIQKSIIYELAKLELFNLTVRTHERNNKIREKTGIPPPPR